MACGCKKSVGGNRQGNSSPQQLKKVFSNTRSTTNNQQLQVQALGLNSSGTPSQMNSDRRKIEKLRRDAVRKALNR